MQLISNREPHPVLEEDLLSSSSGRGGSRKTIKDKNPNRIVDETSKEMKTT